MSDHIERGCFNCGSLLHHESDCERLARSTVVVPGDENFARIVREAVESERVSRRALAQEFEIAESTVHRWERGVASPHPLIKKQVIDYIGGKNK